jgi:hypothetical protein
MVPLGPVLFERPRRHGEGGLPNIFDILDMLNSEMPTRMLAVKSVVTRDIRDDRAATGPTYSDTPILRTRDNLSAYDLFPSQRVGLP